MDEKDEKEYNDIESLAAYLHSGKMQALKAAGERMNNTSPAGQEQQETAAPAEAASDVPDGVLFTSVERRPRRAQRPAAHDEDIYDDMTGQYDESEDLGFEKRSRDRRRVVSMDVIRDEYDDDENDDVTVRKPKNKDTDRKKSGNVLAGVKEKLSKLKEGSDRKPAGHTRTSAATEASADAIPALAESLSAAVGEEAVRRAEEQLEKLPPEDTPEIYDVEEGSEEEETFDATATRLMNAVNDPKMRSVSMIDDVEAEEEEQREEKRMAAKLRLGYERQKQSTRTLAYILIALMLCVAILGAAAYTSNYLIKWALDFSGIASYDFKIDIDIPEDATIETVAAILSENNIISDAKFFKFYAETADKFKAPEDRKDFVSGRFTVSSTMSYSTLLSTLRTKETVRKTVDVRITEGMTAREIAELLEENNVCFAEDFVQYFKNIQNMYDFERRVNESSLKFNQLEGYLFPDTYQFYIVNLMEENTGRSREDIGADKYNRMKQDSEENAKAAAKKIYSNFNEKITRSMYKKMGEMNMTLDEVIALASMVQKEAAQVDDMGYVASVFLNRIRNSGEFPYLQSDVTVIYAENEIKPYYEGSDITKTRIINAYNTYVCKGIPAGAVCNPGIDAINAVLYAPETSYFYFCANSDTGEVYYAETQSEHENNLILAGIASDLDEAEQIEERLNRESGEIE